MAGKNLNVRQSDPKLERRVLHLMLFHESAIESVIDHDVTWDFFSDEIHQNIFEEILSIYSDPENGGVAIGSDTSFLYDNVRRGFDDSSSREVMEAINAVKAAKSELKMLNIYLTQLCRLYKIRSVVEAIRPVVAYLSENADNIDDDELLNIYESGYQDTMAAVVSRTKSVTTESLFETVVRELIEEVENPSSVKFGLDEIDMNAKLLNGYLTYIAGDTGVGKTTVATNLATSIASDGVTKVLFINLETKAEDCLKKLISAKVKVNGHRIKYERLINPVLMSDEDWDVISNIMDNPDLLRSYGIYWIHQPDMTVEELQREIARHVRMYDIDVIIGDYYQLLTMEGYENEFPSTIIPKISNTLLSIAGRSFIRPDGSRKKIAHIWLAQTNKDVSYRQDKHPTKDDLYYGGSRDARLVIGIYRDEYYHPDDTDKPGIIELGILKQNNGIAGDWYDYVFDAHYQTIRNMTEEERELIGDGGEEDE